VRNPSIGRGTCQGCGRELDLATQGIFACGGPGQGIYCSFDCMTPARGAGRGPTRSSPAVRAESDAFIRLDDEWQSGRWPAGTRLPLARVRQLLAGITEHGGHPVRVYERFVGGLSEAERARLPSLAAVRRAVLGSPFRSRRRA
jgi:hypothetical protein